MIEFLKSLDLTEPRRKPLGVGQKTVNIANEKGFIVSQASGSEARLPDLHCVTIVGVEALDGLLTQAVELPKRLRGRPRLSGEPG